MKISFVNNHYQLGGAETVVRQLHEGALAAGHDSRLYVSDGRSWPQVDGLRPMYPRWLARLDHSRWSGLARRLAPRRAWTDRAFRRLARSDAELIHVHSFHGFYASLESLAAVARAKPLVWTFHRFWGMTGGCDHPFGCERYQTGCGQCPQVGRFAVGPVDHTAQQWLEKERLLAPLPLNIIAPSRHLARQVESSTLGKNWRVRVIPNGVDPTAFSGRRKASPAFRGALGLATVGVVALFACRDFRDPIKGFPLIKRALASREWPQLQVVLVGGHSGWAREQLPAELDVLDLGYVTGRERMADLYEASDIFLYASDGENFPCVILEAMSAECCVVSAPVDGVLEQVTDGATGLIASDGSPEALAGKLAEALALSVDARRVLGAAARASVRKDFSESGMIDAHLAFYEEVIREHGETR